MAIIAQARLARQSLTPHRFLYKGFPLSTHYIVYYSIDIIHTLITYASVVLVYSIITTPGQDKLPILTVNLKDLSANL